MICCLLRSVAEKVTSDICSPRLPYGLLRRGKKQPLQIDPLQCAPIHGTLKLTFHFETRSLRIREKSNELFGQTRPESLCNIAHRRSSSSLNAKLRPRGVFNTGNYTESFNVRTACQHSQSSKAVAVISKNKSPETRNKGKRLTQTI